MSQSQDSPAPRTFLQVFEDEGEESTAAYHAALIKAGKNLTKKLDHDEAEELSVAVENIQDSMTNWNARVQQYRGDIEELDVSHVRFKRTGVDQLGQQNEQLQAEVEHIDPVPSQAPQEEGLITEVKEIFRAQPWLVSALHEDDFPEELRARLEETCESLRADALSIEERMNALEIDAVNKAKRQLSKESENRLKPFKEREIKNDKVLAALKKYVSKHKSVVEDSRRNLSAASEKVLELEQQLDAAVTDSDTKKNEIAGLLKDTERQTRRIQRLEDHLRMQQDLASHKGSELKKAIKRSTQLDEEAAQKERRITSLESDLKDALDGQTLEKSLKESALDALNILGHNLRYTQASVDHEKAHKESAMESVAALKDELAKEKVQKDTALVEVNGKLAALSHELKHTKAQKDSAITSVAGLEHELKQAEDKLVKETIQKDSALVEVNERLAKETAQKDSELTVANTNRLRLESELKSTQVKLTDETAQKVSALGELDATNTSLATLQSELENTKARLGNETNHKVSALDDLAEVNTRLGALASQLESTEAKLTEETEQKVSALNDLAAANTTLDALTSELENAENGLAKETEQKDSAVDELGSVNTNLTTLRQELDHTQKRLAEETTQKDIELDAAKTELVKLKHESKRTQDRLAEEAIRKDTALGALERKLKDATDKVTELETQAAQKNIEYQQLDQEFNNANVNIGRLEGERDQIGSELQQTSNRLSIKEGQLRTKEDEFRTLASEKSNLLGARDEAESGRGKVRDELSTAMNRSMATNAAVSAVLGLDDVLNDLVQLHEAAQSLGSSTHIRGEIIPSIQVASHPSSVSVPTYQDAFELWMSAAKGTFDVDRASIFLQAPNLTAMFLPWIHGAVCKATDALASRINTSPVWSMDLLVQLVTLMQLLVSVQHASQSTIQWEHRLMEIFHALSNSISALPHSILLSTVQKRVQRFLTSNELPGSWVDVTPSPAQLDSTNSLLDKDTYLILDSAADTLALVTGEPQVVYLLGHDDVESLQVEGLLEVTLKLCLPLPVLTMQLQDMQSSIATKFSASLWANHAWFKQHMVYITEG